jgi:hypothetical protein
VAVEGEVAPGDQVVVVTGRDVKDGQTVQRGGQQQRGGAKPAAAAAAADGKGAAR